MSVKLKLVRNTEFARREHEIVSDPKLLPHSLFSLIYSPSSTHPDIANYFLDKFSEQGEVVLDPFCGAGNIPLAAALSGRVPYCSDLNPFSLCQTAAKLQPADITNVTLFMQAVNLKKPVAIDRSMRDLLEFYDMETLREIINLRKSLLNSYEQTARFVEVISLSLLHGNNAGYFSVYTNPHVSVSAAQQAQINMQRKQKPAYRAVLPRVLKKTAQVTADGIPSVLSKASELAILKVQDARDLQFLRSTKVDLILTSVPLPGIKHTSDQVWLKNWFSDIDGSAFFDQTNFTSDIDSWLGFLNESLLEFARVLQQGRNVVLHIRDIAPEGKVVKLAEVLLEYVKDNLNRYWEPVELISNNLPNLQLKNALKPRAGSDRALADRFLVLRRG